MDFIPSLRVPVPISVKLMNKDGIYEINKAENNKYATKLNVGLYVNQSN